MRLLAVEALARALGVTPDTLGDARLDSCATEVLLAYGRIGARRRVKPKPPFRICTNCGEDKPLAAFVPIAGTRGFYGRCRVCRAQRARERYWRDEAFRVKERARRAAGMHQRQADVSDRAR